jgi:glycosyltransferase involved in cell wall biosynthesis
MGFNFGSARIAVLAPISHRMPPLGYGPWEQVAFNVADGLRKRGVDITLFCAANSAFEGKRISVAPAPLMEDPALDGDVFTALHIANLFARAGEFDLIHSHLDWRPLSFAVAGTAPPMVTTIHGFSSPQILAAYYAAAHRSFYCSISDADRDPGLPYAATVYNGIDVERFEYRAAPDEYLLFFGRIHEEKGPHVAIDVAVRARRKIILAGIVHDATYYRDRIAPLVDGDRVRFVGEVTGDSRSRLLGGAFALLQMNTRPERFGLSMIEAMACGTPVIGARTGSIPEVIEDGVTGFVCDGVDEAVLAVGRVAALSRAACRARVGRLFTIDAMIDGYLKAYALALERRLPESTDAQRAARSHDWWDRPMSFTDVGPKPRSLEGAMPDLSTFFVQ